MGYQLNTTKFLDEDEVAELLKYLPRGRPGLMIELGLRSGARATELLRITKADLDSKRSSVFIRGIKKSNDRTVILERTFFDRLKYYADRCEGEKLFPISYSTFRRIWLKYRPPNKKLHSLRHTFGVNVYKASKDIQLVKTCLGHKNIQNTAIYMDFVHADEEQAKYMKDLYGKSKRETQNT